MREIMNKRKLTTISVICIIVLCLISIASAKASPEKVEDILTSYLLDNYPWEEIHVRNIQIIGRVDDIIRPDRIVVERGPIGKAVFSFIYNNGKKLLVRANVRAFGWVVKSKRPFKKKHVIHEEDIYLAKMDIIKMPSSTVKDPREIIGKTLKRSIAANIPIVEDMIETSQVVKRGKRVILLINQGGLSITAAGKLKEKGYIGKQIRAINISSKKEVIGILIDENTVKVEL
jgi:flagella basal body P-ring formation protein FlgA